LKFSLRHYPPLVEKQWKGFRRRAGWKSLLPHDFAGQVPPPGLQDAVPWMPYQAKRLGK